MGTFERHLFICVNERDPSKKRPSCAAAGALEVASALKKAAYDRGLKRVVRVNKSGCLDQCEHGVVCVVYPEGTWYAGVTVADAQEIVDQHLLAGRPVERLILSPEKLTGKPRPELLKNPMSIKASPLDEEAKLLLRRIMESMARHQLSSINTLGHCLKFIDEVDVKLVVAGELDLSLRLFRDVRALYSDLGWTDLECSVRDRLNELPVPASRLEFGVAYFITGLAERVAMGSYESSSCPEFAALARSHFDVAVRRPEPKRFIAYCEDESHRPQAQQFFDRWIQVARGSLGRPDSKGASRAVELGIRSLNAAQMNQKLTELLQPLAKRCGLELAV